MIEEDYFTRLYKKYEGRKRVREASPNVSHELNTDLLSSQGCESPVYLPTLEQSKNQRFSNRSAMDRYETGAPKRSILKQDPFKKKILQKQKQVQLNLPEQDNTNLGKKSISYLQPFTV